MKIKILLIIMLGLVCVSQSFAMGGKPALPKNINAEFITNKGSFTCQLFPESAPKTVANFVGLAKGEKEWLDSKTHENVKKPLYNGTIFHRVIAGFMIQGGDPLGLGVGGPGYKFEDEIDPALTFDQPGILAMANSGPNTNGSQFFITVAPTPWLNAKHTIFGKVTSGYDVVEAISKVKTSGQNRPIEPVVIKEVKISY